MRLTQFVESFAFRLCLSFCTTDLFEVTNIIKSTWTLGIRQSSYNPQIKTNGLRLCLVQGIKLIRTIYSLGIS